MAEFFARLDRHGHERLPRRTSGSIRFDLCYDGRTENWLVTIERGAVRVTRESGAAVIRVDGALFERMGPR